MKNVIETIYFLSANSRVEFKWYQFIDGETRLFQENEPECWFILNHKICRIHTQHAGFALIYDCENRPNTVFTGLLAGDRVNSGGKIQDTLILVSPDQSLTENQIVLMQAFFYNIGKTMPMEDAEFYNSSCLSSLSKAIEDKAEHGVSLNPHNLIKEINDIRQLVQASQKITGISQHQHEQRNADSFLTEGIYLHTAETRHALANILLTKELPLGHSGKPVVAIITQFVRAKNLGKDIVWGLTDDPTAGSNVSIQSSHLKI